MMSPGFVDLLLLLVLLTFTIKGYVTGFIRSVVTLVAVIVAFAASSIMPLVGSFALGYSFSDASPNYFVANRIVAFIIFFAAAQGVGFLATGLFEKIGLGTADKAVGLVLGIATGVLAGSLPGVAIYQSPQAYDFKPNQRYFKASALMKAYTPVIKALAKPPKPKKK